MIRRIDGALLAPAMVLLPSIAFANAGTPLMWAGMLYLCGGNVVIGIIEGWILSKWFRLPTKRCVWWMIAANLVSAWIGHTMLTALLLLPLNIAHDELTSVGMLLIAAPFAAWIATLIIEWPFTRICFRGEQHALRRSLVATAVIQTVSCAILASFFFWSSAFGMIVHHKIVPSDELPWPPGLEVYYIDSGGRDIMALDTDTGDSRLIHRMKSELRDYGTAVYFSPEPTHADLEVRELMAGEYGNSHVEESVVEMLGIFVDTSNIHRTRGHWQSEREDDRERFPFGDKWHPYDVASNPVSIGPQPKELKSLRQGFWDFDGLSYEYGDFDATGARRVALSTPFAGGHIRNTMVLPDGYLLFQFGRNRVCLLDMKTQRIAQKLRGFGPIAVPKDAIVVDRVDDVDAVESEQGGL